MRAAGRTESDARLQNPAVVGTQNRGVLQFERLAVPAPTLSTWTFGFVQASPGTADIAGRRSS